MRTGDMAVWCTPSRELVNSTHWANTSPSSDTRAFPSPETHSSPSLKPETRSFLSRFHPNHATLQLPTPSFPLNPPSPPGLTCQKCTVQPDRCPPGSEPVACTVEADSLCGPCKAPIPKGAAYYNTTRGECLGLRLRPWSRMPRRMLISGCLISDRLG